jgi:hypothetical protein
VLLVVLVGIGAVAVGRTAADPSAADATAAAARRPEALSPTPETVSATKTAARSTSMRVLHQHLMGSCRGRLVVSQAGVAFVPDDRERQGADRFRFRHGEFLHELGDDVLTIKSNDRTYRFKAADSPGIDSSPQLRKLVAAMAPNR